MAPTPPLETADQVAGIVGAVAGVVAVTRGRIAPRPLIWPLVALTAVVFAVRFVPGAPPAAGTVSGWAAAALGICALLVALSPARPAGDRLEDLLREMRDAGARHPYRFLLDGSAPPLPDVYVPRHPVPAGPGDEPGGRRVDPAEIFGGGHVLLTGPAGAGKSTMATIAVARAAERALDTGDHRRIVIALPAADLVRHRLPAALAEACRRDYGTDVGAGLFGRPPSRHGHWWVIIDGLDEVTGAADRDLLLARLHGLLDHPPPGHRFVIMSRPLAAGELARLTGPGVTSYQLRPFDRQELDLFARKWFAARCPDPATAARRTGEFLTRVNSARLGPVAHVPLLATIAAMVHADTEIPAGPGELHELFAQHLIEGRHELAGAQAALTGALDGRGRAGEAAGWLERDFHGILGRLLDALGAVRVADPGADLVTAAMTWLDGAAPHPFTAALPGARRMIADLLRGTGLLAASKGRLAFPDQSFAEYFAARGTAAGLDPDAWRAIATDPVRRGLAAFAAELRPDADELVGSLLGEPDPIAAGDMIASGVPVTAATRAAVLDALLERLGTDTAATGAMRVLRALSVDADVLARMTATARDGDVPGWTRVVLADAVADVDPATGIPLLRAVSGQVPAGPSGWARDGLRARGEPVDAGAYGPDGDQPDRTGLGSLAREALRSRAADRDFGMLQRLEAAERLARDGDPGALRDLLDEPGLPPLFRLAGATGLAALGDDGRLRTLAGPGPDLALRYSAAVELFRRRPAAAAPELRSMITGRAPSPLTYGCAARLADLGEREWLMRLATAPPDRSRPFQAPLAPALLAAAAARRLVALGDGTGQDALDRLISADGMRPLNQAYRAAVGSAPGTAVSSTGAPSTTASVWWNDDPRFLENVITDPGLSLGIRLEAVTRLATVVNTAWPVNLRRLDLSDEWMVEIVGGMAVSGIPYPVEIALPAATAAMFAALADRPGTPAALRVALAQRLAIEEALPRLCALAGSRDVPARHRISAIRVVAARSPAAARPLLATVIRERWLPRPLRWLLLHQVFATALAGPGRLGWPEFRSVTRTTARIRDARSFPVRLVLALAAMATRPTLDGQHGPAAATVGYGHHP
ncbi:NACHT domain-containing protein [Actinoplanes sp. NPDC049802]|uniref:NACHT domain-containing protein n=1 Tax=Actinoplanes sp. NPDC049802 TaxID=3154742 RepID=UPI0033C73956